MNTQAKRKPYKGIALALSLLAILLWAFLGTSASLAWFTDAPERVSNIFHFAEFDVEVSHRLEDGSWETIDGKTDIFDDQALYEPGYVQVVYLKVENKGTVAFDFYTAVSINEANTATNVFGDSFKLQDYLKFGVAIADSEPDMELAVENRDLAKAIATMDLNDYATDVATLDAGATSYLALVVRMPEEVDNVANYRGDTVPKVDLGIIAKATQITN